MQEKSVSQSEPKRGAMSGSQGDTVDERRRTAEALEPSRPQEQESVSPQDGGKAAQEQDKYFIAFSHLIGTSPLFKAKLLEFFDFDVRRAWNCGKNDLKTLSVAYPELSIPRGFIAQRDALNPDKLYVQTSGGGVNYITINSRLYPELLKNIPDPPLMLYYKGDLATPGALGGDSSNACADKLNPAIFENTLAVVGSRRASEGAKLALDKIVRELQNAPVTIVSGLALGIDAQAHKSAIEAGLKTIGVIGCGINKVYPHTNAWLYKKIEDGAGLIMSEFPPDVPPMAHHFPQRNRIVTGLSHGTLVVEAALKSGALISGNLTLEQGRELMCMPGLISNPNTEGVYKLLKDGATLTTCANDIFEALNWSFETASQAGLNLKDAEKYIFDIISLEGATTEKIQQQSGLEIAELMITLTGLELRGLIKQINGRYFVIMK